MDMTKVCRSCMKKVSLRASKRSDNDKLLEMFCFCINISEEDKLPQQFCSACVSKIQATYSFITEAQKVDLTLRNLLSRIETSVIVELERNTNNDESSFVKSEMVANEKDSVEIKTETPDESVCISESKLECSNTTLNINEKHTVKDEVYPDNCEVNDLQSIDGTDDQNYFTSLKGDEEIDKKMARKRNVCVICVKRFVSKLWYAKHMAKEHSQRKYSCKHCPKTFTMHSKLKEHSMVHSSERKFSCPECGKRYKRRCQLSEHMHNHQETKPFVCNLCSKSFKRKGVLVYHMTFHQNEKKHLCSVCGMCFFSKSNLTTHMRTHTGEKPFQCSSCSKAFNTTSSLRRHERLHRGEAAHACETCAKPFSSLGSLARHRRTHTGELPYKCPWCARAFADSWKRKVHLMRAHHAGLADIPRLSRAGEPVAGRGRPPRHALLDTPAGAVA